MAIWNFSVKFINNLQYYSIMIKLDKKDIEILKILNDNAREYNASIAKKLKISKQSVGYRINRMEKEGIIKNFYTEFNVSKLGYNTYYIFLQLERITNKSENEIISKFLDEDNVGWIINGIGKWNIILLIYAKSMTEFEKLFFHIKNICSNYLRDATFSILTKSQKISYRFLNVKPGGIQTEKLKKIELDSKDNKIMESIAQNARATVMELCRKTRLSPDIITYRLKKLQKEGITNGFKIKLDVTKFGIQWYLLLIQLQNISEDVRKKFINFLTNQKEVYYLTSTIGNYDLLVDLHVQNSTNVRDFIFKIREKFPETIKVYESLLIFKEHKISYLPNLLS